MNVDLLKTNNITLDTQSKAILINSAKSIMESFSNLDLVGLETNVKVTEKERGWYDGSTMREFPYIVDHDTYNYQLETSRPSGSFITPHFKEEFNDTKVKELQQSWHSKTSSLSLESSTGQLWQLVKTLNKDATSTRGTTVIEEDGSLHTGRRAAKRKGCWWQALASQGVS